MWCLHMEIGSWGRSDNAGNATVFIALAVAAEYKGLVSPLPVKYFVIIFPTAIFAFLFPKCCD